MKYHGQNLDHDLTLRLVVFVIALMGKAAAEINFTGAHFACNLPICKPGKQFCCRKPSDDKLHKKHYLYKHLNTLMLEET